MLRERGETRKGSVPVLNNVLRKRSYSQVLYWDTAQSGGAKEWEKRVGAEICEDASFIKDYGFNCKHLSNKFKLVSSVEMYQMNTTKTARDTLIVS